MTPKFKIGDRVFHTATKEIGTISEVYDVRGSAEMGINFDGFYYQFKEDPFSFGQREEHLIKWPVLRLVKNG